MSTISPTATMTFALFSGRHELPDHLGALFAGWDFKTQCGVRTDWFGVAIQALRAGQHVNVLVTGLTPALTEFLSFAFAAKQDMPLYGGRCGKLTLQHFDRDTNTYWTQTLWE